jgi:T5orf172 domain
MTNSSLTTKIYAYTDKYNAPLGRIKIGMTIRDRVDIRVKAQTQTASSEKNFVEILYETEAITDQGKTFDDHLVHRKLVAKGINRLEGEWFECDIDQLKNVILEIKTGR